MLTSSSGLVELSEVSSAASESCFLASAAAALRAYNSFSFYNFFLQMVPQHYNMIQHYTNPTIHGRLHFWKTPWMASSKPYGRPGVKRNITASNILYVFRTVPIWVITQQAAVIPC